MNIIVAVYADWGIGFNGTQPIVLREDRLHFKELTSGGTVIAGRRTLDDFPGGQPLPGRKNIILTRNRSLQINGAVTVGSPDELFAQVAGENPNSIFVIGGASIYKLLLPFCKQAYVTKIEASLQSDVFFPDLEALPDWTLDRRGETLESNGLKYSFDTYVNKLPSPCGGEGDK